MFNIPALLSAVLDGFSQGPTTAVLVAAAVVVPGALLVTFALRPKPDPSVRLPHTLSTTLPIVGNLIDVVKVSGWRQDWITQMCEKYQGDAFQLSMPGQNPAVFVYTPQAVEDVLKTKFEVMPKGPTQEDNFRELLGHGIFATDGPKWIHQRKTASNLFTARALRETMTESMRRYAIILDRILTKASDSQAPVDVFKLMNKFTIEAFAKMGFGIDMNCLDSDVEHPFQSAFDSAQRMLLLRFTRPIFYWKMKRFLNIGTERQLKHDIEVIDKTVMDIIAQSLARRASQGGKKIEGQGGGIVSLFLDRFDDSTGEQFDPKYLRDIVVNFIIAGRDTTAQAMSWCFYNLSQRPDVVAKIRAEIAQNLPEFANGTRSEPPTMDEVQQLTYLDAVLKETLRLHPSVPMLPKTAAEDTILSDGTLIRAHSTVVIPTYAMGRMEFVWGADARQFKPERWIDEATGKLVNESTFKFASFNAGPRICLGMNLAMLEMKIVMASVLMKFNVEFLEPESVIYGNSLTLPFKGEVFARVTRN